MEDEIRTDLWLSMDINELNNQRDLILTKISLLSQLTSTQTVINIHSALQHALQDINQLIDYRTESVRTPIRTSQHGKPE